MIIGCAEEMGLGFGMRRLCNRSAISTICDVSSGEICCRLGSSDIQTEIEGLEAVRTTHE